MNKQESQIENLIDDYCRGRLSRERAEKLKEWLKEDVDNQKVLQHYRSLYYNARTIDFVEQVDKEMAWGNISKAISTPKTHRISHWIPYAAAVAVIAILSVFLLNETNKGVDFTKEYNFAKLTEVGSKKAVLILADGSKVNLQEKLEQNILEADGTQITKDSSNNLAYKSAESADSKLIYNKIEVPRGGEYSITLSDGTKVWLNSDSELRYPVKFTPNKRDVYLVGEAYFEVAHNGKSPFVVHTHDSKIRVLGTKFNVSGYEDEEFIVTTLVEGSVEVNSLEEAKILKPGLQSTIKRGRNEIEVSEVNPYLYTSWVQGVFEFEDVELEYIMAQLGRWYDVKFFFSEEKFKHIRFTGAIKRDKPFEFALDLIEKIAEVDFAIQDESIIVGRPK